MSGFLKKIGLGILAVVILGLAFFFFYVVKTPQYSLYLIHKAVQSHDTVSFEQHVDMDTIYSKGIDDLIASGLKGKKTIGADPFSASIIKLVKPTVVKALKDATLESVMRERPKDKVQAVSKENGQTAQNDNALKKKNRKEDIIPLVKKLKERVDVSNLKIKDASITRKDSNTADISALLHNNKLNKDFNINFRMDKLANGEWQIKEITNFVELLTKVEEATKQAAREAVNETVQEKKKQ
ncbi:MAG: hypothetical protein IJQ91_03030 [Acidaminococcaceae bacterium]|nr:hypothetical protein [Acidaminococcaceae bacterium]